MSNFQSTKLISLGSCAFRQPAAKSHCRWIHGYRLQAKFWFGCDKLDNNNWVVDFGGLKGLRKKLERQFDHTMCIAANDPALPYFQDLANEDVCDLRIMEKGTGIERIAEWCFDIADHLVGSMTKNRCWVDRVEVFEHENNSAAYNRPLDLEGVSSFHATGQQELDLRFENGEPLRPRTTVENTTSCEVLAEDIATAADKKQQKKKEPKETPVEGVESIHLPNKQPGQSRVTNKWIDPESTNPWGF